MDSQASTPSYQRMYNGITSVTISALGRHNLWGAFLTLSHTHTQSQHNTYLLATISHVCMQTYTQTLCCILHYWTQQFGTTTAGKPYGQQETALFSSLTAQQQSDFTLASYSLTPFSSLWLPVVFPFEADLISHIRTSIFLKRAEWDCFDPFRMRKLKPAKPATPKREIISFHCFLQVSSWLTWERSISFT